MTLMHASSSAQVLPWRSLVEILAANTLNKRPSVQEMSSHLLQACVAALLVVLQTEGKHELAG
jgi:hypothetical protein